MHAAAREPQPGVALAQQSPADQRRKQHRHLARGRHVAERRELQRVQHHHIAQRRQHRHHQRPSPAAAPGRQRAGRVAQHDRQTEGDAQQIAEVVDQQRRDHHHLDCIAVDHRVAGDAHAGGRAVGDAVLDAQPLRRVAGTRAQLAHQPRPAGDQEHAPGHRRHARDAEGRQRLAQQQHRADRAEQRPGAARDRIDHGQVGGAVAAQQQREVQQVRQRTRQRDAPLQPAPARQHAPRRPDAERRPQHRDHQRRQQHEALIAPGMLGGQVPQRMAEGGSEDEGQGGGGHRGSLGAPHTHVPWIRCGRIQRGRFGRDWQWAERDQRSHPMRTYAAGSADL